MDASLPSSLCETAGINDSSSGSRVGAHSGVLPGITPVSSLTPSHWEGILALWARPLRSAGQPCVYIKSCTADLGEMPHIRVISSRREGTVTRDLACPPSLPLSSPTPPHLSFLHPRPLHVEGPCAPCGAGIVHGPCLWRPQVCRARAVERAPLSHIRASQPPVPRAMAKIPVGPHSQSQTTQSLQSPDLLICTKGNHSSWDAGI